MRNFLKLALKKFSPRTMAGAAAIAAATGAFVFQDELLDVPPMGKATNAAVSERLDHIAKGPVVEFRHLQECEQQGLTSDFCYAALLNYVGTIRQWNFFDDPYRFKGVYPTRSLSNLRETNYRSRAEAVRACESEHTRRNCIERENGALVPATFVVRQGETDPRQIEVVWPMRHAAFKARDGKSYNLRPF